MKLALATAAILLAVSTYATTGSELVCMFMYLDSKGNATSTQLKQVPIAWGQPYSFAIDFQDAYAQVNVDAHMNVPPFQSADVWMSYTDLRSGLVFKSRADLRPDQNGQSSITLDIPIKETIVNGTKVVRLA